LIFVARSGLFEVIINTSKKQMVCANLDNQSLTPSQTLTLCWFNTITMNHVKIHALANWAVNLDATQNNPLLFRNSLVTVIYNHYGYHSFLTFFDFWKKCALLDKSWKASSLKYAFDVGINENIQAHPDITDLYKHSRLVKFIVLVRKIFLKHFDNYKDFFPGINAEALFAGTVLHSLDHKMMEWNLDDPLWLDVHDKQFRMMAQLGRIVRVGFVSDVPGLYFHKKFKDSGHPFYESVYKEACKVDENLAEYMDTCIAK